MHTAVTQGPGDQLDAAIVPVQAHLAKQHAGPVVQIAAAIDLLEDGCGFGGGVGHFGAAF